MIARLVLPGVVSGVLAAAPAHADSFEAKAQGAIAIRRLDDLVWPFTAACDRGDDVQQRQCRQIRDRRVKQLAGATLLVRAEPSAFAAGAWNAAKKSVPLSLISCVACTAVDVDGKAWFVTGAGPRVDGNKVRGGVLYDNAKAFPDEAGAGAWTKTLANVRVELVVKVPANRRSQLAGKDAFVVDVVAWRVVNPCDGSIVIANPESAAVAPDKKACAGAPTLK